MLSLDSREDGCVYLGTIEELVIRNSLRHRECSHLMMKEHIGVISHSLRHSVSSVGNTDHELYT